jgi:hypothetical protein
MKTMLRRKWNEWYAGDQHTFTPCGNMRKPELTDVCQWIADAWAELDPGIIIHAFKQCCISNKMDGTEDDILWEDNAKHEDHSESEDKDDDESYYAATPGMMTDEDIQRLFESDDDEEEFDAIDCVS